MTESPSTQNFRSAILIYTKNTIAGWFSAVYKVAALYDKGGPVERVLRNEESFKLIVSSAQDYFNQTNDKIYTRSDEYVNRFFHHFFATTFGQELPCIFLELLMAFVLDLTAEVWLEDLYKKSPPQVVWANWDLFIEHIKSSIQRRATSTIALGGNADAVKIDLFVLKCQKAANSCACKGLTTRPYKPNPFKIDPTMIRTAAH